MIHFLFGMAAAGGPAVLPIVYGILSFTGIFVVGYALIWLVIYLCIRPRAASINRKLDLA